MGARAKRALGGRSRTLAPGVVRITGRILPGTDALVTPALSTTVASIVDPFLRDVLDGRELGTWTLSPLAIDELLQRLSIWRPELAIEFGSGVSTVCLAHGMRQQRDDLTSPWVISIEQDAEHVTATESLLAAAGLADAAIVLHAPLARTQDSDTTRSAHVLPHERIAAAMAERRLGLVFVDGPAAESGARVTTVPAVRRHLRGDTPVVLDDALRDGEIEAARTWEREGLVVDGRYLLAESGLFLGVVRAP